MPDPTTQRGALKSDPNVGWLLWGSIISNLGDQLTIVALPWLVLKLTRIAPALGLVVALMGTPRAVFIPIRGVEAEAPELGGARPDLAICWSGRRA